MERTVAPGPSNAEGRRGRRRRERLLPFAVFIVVLVAIALTVVARERNRARAIIVREDVARATLWQVRRAQSAYHVRTGRYAWVEDLARAGLLAGLDVVEAPGRWFVRTPGYRIDVLLPHARLGGDAIGIAVRDAPEQPDPELSTRHVALVARPLEPARSGHRMWYLDEQDELFLNEGVVDDEGARRNHLPAIAVRAAQTLDTARLLLWQRAAEVPRLTD